MGYQSDTSSLGVTVNQRPFGMVSVKEFGATGDGTTNDTTAIQNAIDYVDSIGGGVVYVPPGTYMVDPGLTLYADMIFEGSGATSIIKLLPQNLASSSTWAILKAYGTMGATPDPANRIRNVGVQNLAIDGSLADHTGTPTLFQEGLTFAHVEDSFVHNVTIKDTVHNGFQYWDCRNIRTTSVSVFNARGWGIHQSENGEGLTWGNQDCIVSNCYAEGCGFPTSRGGIDCNPGTSNCIVANNVCRDNYKNFEILGSNNAYLGNQSLGTPTVTDVTTGATIYPRVVASGSNYVRYSDGIQIIFTAVRLNYDAGSLGAVWTNWIYPVAFVANPRIQVTPGTAANSAPKGDELTVAQASGITTNSANLYVNRIKNGTNFAPGNFIDCEVHAIGRWF